jgi:cytochrome c556
MMSSLCVFRRAVAAALISSIAVIGIVKAAPRVSELIKSRQDKLRDMGGALKGINDELKKRNPDWDNAIARDAETLQSRSKYLLNWFPKGTGEESGLKTYALPGVWQKPDDFSKLAKAMIAETVKLSQVASTKDAAALRTEVIVLGKSCKACHDNYRSPDYEKENEDE